MILSAMPATQGLYGFVAFPEFYAILALIAALMV